MAPKKQSPKRIYIKYKPDLPQKPERIQRAGIGIAIREFLEILFFQTHPNNFFQIFFENSISP
jgi:hypothetical protein